MLTLQARVTLIAYVILMVAFFIPLKGDMDLLNKFGTSLIMLLPVSLSVYIINCMVTGSKAKLGLGCNAIAWIESLYILIIAVIVLLYNLMNSKKDNVEDFYGSPYNFYGSSYNFYGSSYVISDYDCDNIVTNFGSTCSIKNNMCVREITIETGSNCIGSQSYTEYEQCYGNDSNVCIFGNSSVNADYQTRRSFYNDLISSFNSTEFSNINLQLIERLTNSMTLEQISNLNTPKKLENFLDSVNDIMVSGDYNVSNNQDIQDIISSSQIGDSNNDENNILYKFITAITRWSIICNSSYKFI